MASGQRVFRKAIFEMANGAHRQDNLLARKFVLADTHKVLDNLTHTKRATHKLLGRQSVAISNHPTLALIHAVSTKRQNNIVGTHKRIVGSRKRRVELQQSLLSRG